MLNALTGYSGVNHFLIIERKKNEKNISAVEKKKNQYSWFP